jgi:hypothetical protein
MPRDMTLRSCSLWSARSNVGGVEVGPGADVRGRGMGIGVGGVPPIRGDCELRFRLASAPLGPKRPDCIKLAKRLAAGAGRAGGAGALGIEGIGMGTGMGIDGGGIGIGRPPDMGMPVGGIGIGSGAPII